MKTPLQLEQKMCTNVKLFLCKSTTYADKAFRFNWNEIPHEYEIYFWYNTSPRVYLHDTVDWNPDSYNYYLRYDK